MDQMEKARKSEIANEHNIMLKNKVFEVVDTRIVFHLEASRLKVCGPSN
jgi:hypothetical protein